MPAIHFWKMVLSRGRRDVAVLSAGSCSKKALHLGLPRRQHWSARRPSPTSTKQSFTRRSSGRWKPPGRRNAKSNRSPALDWKAGTLGVTHGVKRVKDRDASSGRRTRPVVSELKTPKSRRTLSLTPEMVARFRQHRTRQAEAQMAAGTLWRDHGLIFASEVGTPMDPDNFSHSFVRLGERAGLGHWHPHELRHSGASPVWPRARRCMWSRRYSGMPALPLLRTVTDTCSKATNERRRSRRPGLCSAANVCPVAPSVAPKGSKKAPPVSGEGPLTWARSEGLEPPTF